MAAFAAAPLLGAVVGGTVGLQSLVGHGGHAFADEQDAWAILPAFQAGLFTALWIAVAGGGRSWRWALAGFGGVVAVQPLLRLPVDELAHHYGFDPHVGLGARLRPWRCPPRPSWALTGPAPFTVLKAPAPALPQAR